MFENCQRLQMVLGLGVLTLVTIFVLIIESRNAAESSPAGRRGQQFVIENNSTCWKHETTTVVQVCHPCSEFDIVSRSLGVCIHTHYKEVLRCKSGEIVTRSCDRVALIEQRKFIVFETFSFVLGVLSDLISYARERVLARRNYLRIERQLNRMR